MTWEQLAAYSRVFDKAAHAIREIGNDPTAPSARATLRAGWASLNAAALGAGLLDPTEPASDQAEQESHPDPAPRASSPAPKARTPLKRKG